MPKATSKKKKQIIYKPPQDEVYSVMEDFLEYKVSCPLCEKRAIDVSDLPERLIRLQYKCPHCHNIVQTPLIAQENGKESE